MAGKKATASEAKTAEPLAARVKAKVGRFEQAEERKKQFAKDKRAASDREIWTLAWNRQMEVIDGWLKPVVRAGADYQVELRELEDADGLYTAHARVLTIAETRMDIFPLPSKTEDGKSAGLFTSPKDEYVLLWDPGAKKWEIGKQVVEEHKKAGKVESRTVWRLEGLTRETFEAALASLL